MKPDMIPVMPVSSSREAQTLLIDADDTLWENNIYFERVIASFISFLNHHEFTPEQVRAVLDEVEHDCILRHGYGLRSFVHALTNTFERLAVEPLTPAIRETIHGLAQTIADHPVEIFSGVPETLDYLSGRHHLILMTKGAIAEQTGKIERSGLKEFFAAVEIVAEKNAPTYRGMMEKYSLVPEESWMVGNSPKSDINPALAAGLNAVFVPHDNTWVLEHEEVASAPPGRQLLVLEEFSRLCQRF